MAAGQRRITHAHKLVAETAEAMAHEVYDALMERNDWYRDWKRQNVGVGAKVLETRWVRQHKADFIEAARAQLAGMLAHPIDPKEKEAILEALLLDNTLKRGRAGGGQVVMGEA